MHHSWQLISLGEETEGQVVSTRSNQFSTLILHGLSLIDVCACVCVCMRERARQSERESQCVHLHLYECSIIYRCIFAYTCKRIWVFMHCSYPCGTEALHRDRWLYAACGTITHRTLSGHVYKAEWQGIGHPKLSLLFPGMIKWSGTSKWFKLPVVCGCTQFALR